MFHSYVYSSYGKKDSNKYQGRRLQKLSIIIIVQVPQNSEYLRKEKSDLTKMSEAFRSFKHNI